MSNNDVMKVNMQVYYHSRKCVLCVFNVILFELRIFNNVKNSFVPFCKMLVAGPNGGRAHLLLSPVKLCHFCENLAKNYIGTHVTGPPGALLFNVKPEIALK